MLYQQICTYWSHMGYLCGASQMGLTEQLLYLGICLYICKDQGQSCEHWYGYSNVHSCHLIRLISGHLFLQNVHLQYELTQFKWIYVNHVTNH